MIVRLNSTLRGQSGLRTVEVDLLAGATVLEVLVRAIADIPILATVLANEQGDLRSDLIIFRNGRNIVFEQGLETHLNPDDKLDLFPLTGAQRVFVTQSYLRATPGVINA